MIRAIGFRDGAEFRAQRIAGSTYFDLTQGRVKEAALWFYCPCGCGVRRCIIVGIRQQSVAIPSWNWNGSLRDPSLTPSVNQTGCGWHGWLRDGYWETAA